MSCVYVTSDWHLGHNRISEKFRTNFSSDEEHNETILHNYYEAGITKRDTVWFLGDICFHTDYLERIRQLPGIKKLVLGNHDTDKGHRPPIEQLILTFDQVYGLAKNRYAWFSHAPIHPEELRGFINIHGHVHQYSIDDPRYFNACLENTEYKPIKFQTILEIMRERRNDQSKS